MITKENGLCYFHIQEILLPYNLTIWGRLKDNCHLALLRLRLKSNQRALARLIDFKLSRLAK